MLSNRFELAAKAQVALQKINNNKMIQETANQAPIGKPDYTKIQFEEFDENVFDMKLKLDSYFYKNMLKELPAENLAETVQIISDMNQTVHDIYEHINIKPKTYGFNLTTSFNNSEEILESQAQKYMNDYLRDNYYMLTTEQRSEKYFNKIKPIAEGIIIENEVDENTALEYASKVVLMENIIHRICFPLTIQSVIQESLDDESYGEIFEQDQLNNLWETYKTQSYNFARLVSLLV